jgi:hypothetical protein
VTPPTIAIRTSVDNILGAGQAASDLAIVVVLNGVTYDAVVSARASTAEDGAVDLAHATLPDGDYAMTADVCADPRLTLRATSAGNNIVACLTLAPCGTADLPGGMLSLGFNVTPDLPKVARGQHFSLAESGHTWVPHSTRQPTSKHTTLSIRSSAGRIVIPSNLVLTPRVLLGALSKLPTPQIEYAVEELVEVLYGRYSDPDLEGDPDSEDGEEV